jgi:DNA-binding LacI/PurR family transcriptional regulator
MDTVMDDGMAGAGMLVEHLVTLGHRLIAHLDGGQSAYAEAQRTGYERAMLRLGLTAWIVPAGTSEHAGVSAIQALLSGARSFSAVMAADDLCAIGAVDGLEAAGVAVPEEVSVVGYGNTSAASLARIGLTTAGPRRREMGELAMRTLLERIQGQRSEPVRHLVLPQLVIRRTATTFDG